jgi:cyclohexyl-isocyanide hydratase
MTASPLTIGFLIFPDFTQLDMAGPYEVFALLPESDVRLIWKTAGPVRSEHGMTVLATTGFADCPSLDLVCVPGGPGVNPLLADREALDFLRQAASGARWVTSVCTGALLLGAAGLLEGKRAATHWMWRDSLAAFGATAVAERVVTDGNVITAGGVTAGIDFGLAVAAKVAGRDTAEAIQLGLEYDPKPPFDAGSPDRAPAEIVAAVKRRATARQAERNTQVARAAQALRSGDHANPA